MKLSELQEEFWRKEHEVTEERLVRGALICKHPTKCIL